MLPQTSTDNPRTAWFTEARFGMFIHWGLYSLHGRGEWARLTERIPEDEYRPLMAQFAPPSTFHPREWVALAKEAGMRYMVLTTRHHDGFSLFDSQVSDFTAPRSAAGRDFVAEYVEACREAGLRVGLYYSLDDWRFPAQHAGPKKDPKGWAELVEYVHAQVRELCTNYGTIDLLWYDGASNPGGSREDSWQAVKLNRMVRDLQPQIMINDRSGTPEDFYTAEQHLTSPQDIDRLWEACATMNKHWGYYPADPCWKSQKECIDYLNSCVSLGGTLLLNIGPRADGSVPEACVGRLRALGQWLQHNGEAIYGAGRSILTSGTLGVVTRKGARHFVHVHWWHGSRLTLPYVSVPIRAAHILGTGQPVRVEQCGTRAFLCDLPEQSPDPSTTVIELELAGEPQVMPPWDGA
jgi:alpha-L-fucosidase